MFRFLGLAILIAQLAFSVQAQSPFNVDPLTGRGSASLPIYTLQCGDLSASIDLQYYGGGGIKMDEGAGNAGVGWSVSLNGAVVRSLRGFPDDYVGPMKNATDLRYGWLHGAIPRTVNDFTPSGDLNLSVCSDEQSDWNLLNGFGSVIDSEPDVFSFNAPGLSGQFVFGRDKKVKIMPYQDLKVDFFRNGVDSLIDKIEITTNVGVKYTFSVKNSVTLYASTGIYNGTVFYFTTDLNRYSQSLSYNQSWYLASIQSPAGANIAYSYTQLPTSSSASFTRVVNETYSRIDTIYSINRPADSYQLNSITACNTQISIDWDDDRVAAVKVVDLTYSQSRKYTLIYSLVRGKELVAGKANAIRKPFLKQFNQEVNCNSYPGYQFDYYGVNLQAGTSWIPFGATNQRDLFGYYDSTAVSDIPDLYILAGDTGNDGERYRIAPATNYVLLTGGGGRSVNPQRSYYGAMKTLVLPSGAKTVIQYEPNTYFDAVSATSLPGAGIRVKRITTYGGDPASDITSKYTYTASKTSTRSSGKWTYAPQFALTDGSLRIRVPDNMAPEEQILYFRTQVYTTGKGRTVYEFQLPGSYPETTNGDFSATLNRVARNSTLTGCGVLGNIRTGYYAYPYVNNTNYSFERGLIKKTSSYTYDGRLVRQTLYNYVRTSAPVVQVSGIRFEHVNNMFQYGKYTLLTNVNNMSYTVADRVIDESDTTKFVETITTNTFNSDQMLSQTAVTNSNTEVLTTTYAYAKGYAATGTDVSSLMINALVAANRHGTLIETVSKNGSTVTGAQLTIFGNGYAGRVLPKELWTLGSSIGFVNSSVTGTNFVTAPGYYPTQYFDAYSSVGIPTVMRDQARNTRSVILDYNGSLPVVNIQGCDASQVVSSGFESGMPAGASTAGTVSVVSTDYWTGKKSLSMASSSAIQQTLVRGSSGSYRFSCWIKCAVATTLSVQIYNGTSYVSTPVSYGAPLNTWQFVEKLIDVSTVPANTSFPLKLVSAAAISLDEILFYPQNADVVTHTYEPLNGKTSDVDSRGNAAFQEYDNMGRVHFLRNRKKDIVQVYDYKYKSPAGTILSSHFTYAPRIVLTTSSVTLTADASCLTGVTYSWSVDDVTQPSTISSLTYAFTENRDYYVRLVVSSTQGTSTSEQIIHPKPVLTGSLTIASGESNQVDCRDSFVRNFTANLTGCYNAATTAYKWYYYFDDAPNLRTVVATTTTNVYEMGIPGSRSFHVGCEITSTCYNGTTKAYENITVTIEKAFTWRVVSPC